MGEEKGNSGLTPHWQGFAQFKKRVSFKKLGASLKCHIESSKGTAQQNRTYCSKEGGIFHEFGVCKADKEKFGAKEAVELAKKGQLEDIWLEAPQLMLRYRLGLERVHLEHYRPSDIFKKCYWLVGTPGTGKSRFAAAFDPHESYIKAPNKWFDAYNKHKNIVINDVDPSNAGKLGYNLKIWSDIYAILAECKGGAVYLEHTTLFVTSNYRINTLYPDPEMQGALHRRFKEIHVLECRETPIGEIEIKTHTLSPNGFGIIKWINQHTIDD